MITPRQKEEFIRRCIKLDGRSPSLDDISKHLGTSIRTRNSSRKIANALIRAGFLERAGHQLIVVGEVAPVTTPTFDPWVNDECPEWQPGDPTLEDIKQRAQLVREGGFVSSLEKNWQSYERELEAQRTSFRKQVTS